METKVKTKEGDGVVRHCAYCLNLCGFPAKLCGGCKKRAYCSKECQKADWSVKRNGQRHVNWCQRHECGEEDVDWEVVPIPNKGLGIRAKKMIPAGMKIIVEPIYVSQNGHPGMKDLEPVGHSLNLKFIQNSFNAPNNTECNGVALRIARVNHACQPNAAPIYDETARVAILFAQRDIQPGEEICICYYYPFFSLYPGVNFAGTNSDLNIQEKLNAIKEMTAFGIAGLPCPTDCPCHDPIILALFDEGRKMYIEVVDLARENKIKEALDAGDKILGIYRRLNVSWFDLGLTEYYLFRVAVRQSETLPRAKEYIRSAAELFKKICPYSEKLTKNFEKLLEHPEMDSNYLISN